MNLNILIEQWQGGGSIASVLELPMYRVEAETRELALAQLLTLVIEWLAAAEVVSLEVKLPHEVADNAWVNDAGIIKDDLDFAEISNAIQAERIGDDESEIDPAVYAGVIAKRIKP